MRYLFFYGTLIAGSGNAVEAAIHRKLVPVGRTTVKGRLYAIRDPLGWYPALLPGSRPVHGIIYEAASNFGTVDLALLDDYEGYDPRHPGRSLYLRKPISFRNSDGQPQVADAYFYNTSLPFGSRCLKGGDFCAWLETNRLRSYSGP
jgi:gamma-glutamylcyclotransferase (GGCT)/AIG2-like uncharacterized protein YtfP